MDAYANEDGRAVEDLRQAVNQITTALNRITTLEKALESARGAIALLKDGISPNSFRVAYDGAKGVKYVYLADEAKDAITRVLGR